jgi:hypothetical protein
VGEPLLHGATSRLIRDEAEASLHPAQTLCAGCHSAFGLCPCKPTGIVSGHNAEELNPQAQLPPPAELTAWGQSRSPSLIHHLSRQRAHTDGGLPEAPGPTTAQRHGGSILYAAGHLRARSRSAFFIPGARRTLRPGRANFPLRAVSPRAVVLRSGLSDEKRYRDLGDFHLALTWAAKPTTAPNQLFSPPAAGVTSARYHARLVRAPGGGYLCWC